MDRQEIEKMISSQKNWRSKIEVSPGLFTGGGQDVAHLARHYLKMANLTPEEMKGKRVLDVGCWDGAMLFHLEKYGANVVGVDVMDPDKYGFNILKKIFNSKVTFFRRSVYDISRSELGKFDIVLFFGVFYHLKHPLLALEKLNEITEMGGFLMGSGTSSDLFFSQGNKSISFAEEYPKINEFAVTCYTDGSFLGDKTNWIIPNQKCVENWLSRSGYDITSIYTGQGIGGRTKQMRSHVVFGAKKVSVPETEHDYF